MRIIQRKAYLGDSVYVEFDANQGLILTTENGYPDDPSNRIVLDGATWSALLAYVEHLNPPRDSERDA